MRLPLIVLVFFGWCCVAQADDLAAVDELLAEASRSLQEQSYKGRLTYEFGAVLETLEVVHLVEDGLQRERIYHLSGTAREFLTAGRPVDCFSIGSLLLRGQWNEGSTSDPAARQSLAQTYHFYIRNDDRIAGREAWVVELVPKDEYRYGMTLALDKQSRLPLMSLVTAGNDTAIERFQFVDLELGDEVSAEDLDPAQAKAMHLQRDAADCKPAEVQPGRWSPRWLPAGFVLAETGRGEDFDEVLTYTDGLSSFSVYISALENPAEARQGLASRGATLAMMTVVAPRQQAHSVVLIGEIPAHTAKRILSSLEELGNDT